MKPRNCNTKKHRYLWNQWAVMIHVLTQQRNPDLPEFMISSISIELRKFDGPIPCILGATLILDPESVNGCVSKTTRVANRHEHIWSYEQQPHDEPITISVCRPKQSAEKQAARNPLEFMTLFDYSTLEALDRSCSLYPWHDTTLEHKSTRLTYLFTREMEDHLLPWKCFTPTFTRHSCTWHLLQCLPWVLPNQQRSGPI